MHALSFLTHSGAHQTSHASALSAASQQHCFHFSYIFFSHIFKSVKLIVGKLAYFVYFFLSVRKQDSCSDKNNTALTLSAVELLLVCRLWVKIVTPLEEL